MVAYNLLIWREAGDFEPFVVFAFNIKASGGLAGFTSGAGS